MPLGPSWNFNIQQNGENPSTTNSSIDRFFWARGVRITGYVGNQGFLAGWIVGGSQSLAAVVLGILALTVSGFPKVLPFIFSVIGFPVLIATFLLALRSRKRIQSEVRLSSNGRRLMYRIGQHIGWNDPEAWRSNQTGAWNQWWKQIFGVRTAAEILNPKSAELFEAGCTQYNRITGLLKLVKDTKGRSTNIAPQIQAAGDEAIISLINQIALLEDSPETQSAIIGQCESQIAKLKELADRFEELVSGPTTLADRLSSTTVMDNVLDQLRMEAQAQEELRVMDRQD